VSFTFNGRKYRCVIFDCDGTLVDTLEDIANAMNHALVHYGFPTVALNDYRAIVGWGIIRLAELAMPQEARTKENIRLVSNFARRLMQEQPLEESLAKPYPGIQELLTELQERKVKTAVLSNKPDSVLRRVISEIFPRHRFDLVYGLRPDSAPKPEPAPVWELLANLDINPHETVFMGDSEIDIETARNAGCYPLGVSWGFRSRETLISSGAASIIDKPGELILP
jgi:phosphoglycolate phosphatase